MEIAGKVQVDVLHGHHLSVAAPGRAALDAEHGAQRGLAQADHCLLPDLVQAIGQTNRGRGLALAGGGWADGGDQDQLGLPGQLADLGQIQLRLVLAVQLQVLRVDAGLRRDLRDLLHLVGLGDLNVRLDFHSN